MRVGAQPGVLYRVAAWGLPAGQSGGVGAAGGPVQSGGVGAACRVGVAVQLGVLFI